jgi:hypothetical protein
VQYGRPQNPEESGAGGVGRRGTAYRRRSFRKFFSTVEFYFWIVSGEI